MLAAYLPDREPASYGDRYRLLHAVDHGFRHAITLTCPGKVVTLALTVGLGGTAATVRARHDDRRCCDRSLDQAAERA